MSRLAWILLFLALLAGAGYYLDRKGLVDVDVKVERGPAAWGDGNFTRAAGDPQAHAGDNVTLTLLVFNRLTLDTPHGPVTAYEAYHGGRAALEADPYDEARRVVLHPTSGSLPLGECVRVEGYIAGQATVTTADGKTIHPAYIQVTNYHQVDCKQAPQP